MNYRAQGGLEYLVILATGIVIASVLITMMTGSTTPINASIQDQLQDIQNQLNSQTNQQQATQKPVCGNLQCESGENKNNCPADCTKQKLEEEIPVSANGEYIIELTEAPVLKIRAEKIKASSGTGYATQAAIEKDLASQLKAQEQKILSQQAQFESDFKEIKTIKKFKNTFNGLTAKLNEGQIKKIQNSPYVKKIYPVLEVKATLMDSVPLIKADEVWQLNKELGKCTKETPKEYYSVFVSSQTYNGNLGGLTGADAKCQSLADAAGLGGKWIAYIGTRTITPAKRIAPSTMPYKLLDGTLIAKNSDNLGRGIIEAQISRTENSVQVSTEPFGVWTGTGVTRDLTDKACSSWTSSSPTLKAWTGAIFWTDRYKWLTDTNNTCPEKGICPAPATITCDTQKRLYCIEQPGTITTPACGDNICNGSETETNCQTDCTCLTGKGVTIGIIDTGVDYTHPDLGGCFGENCKVIGGYDFANEDNDPMDDQGHGTHVAATAAGKGVSSNPIVTTKYYEGDSIANLTGINSLAGQTVSISVDSIIATGEGVYNARVSLLDQGGSLVDSQTVAKGAYLNEAFLGNDALHAIQEILQASQISVDAGSSRGFAEITKYSNQSISPNGVAPDASIVAYKVLDASGSGYGDDIIAAIERAADPNQDGDFSDHLDVINLSLGANCGSYNAYCGPEDPISTAIDNAVDNGVVAVIAAGNSGPGEGTIGTPGTARKAITVGAVYKKDYVGTYWGNIDPRKDQITSFSSRGPVDWSNGTILKPDVLAPGAIICAARHDAIFPEGQDPYYYPCLDNEHVQLAGTSMASPHGAGAAAILLQKNKNWTPEEIKTILKNTAIDLGYSLNEQGFGRINLENAIKAEGKPLTAEINTNGKFVSGTVMAIEGSAKGDDFVKYTLYYKYDYCSGPACWTKLYESLNPIDNGILYDWDTAALEEQKIVLKLIVESQNQKAEAYAFLEVNNTEITQPFDLWNYDSWGSTEQVVLNSKETIEIKGTAAGSNFQKYEIWLCPQYYSSIEQCTKEGISLTNNGMQPIVKGTLAQLAFPTHLGSGFYTILLDNYYNNQTSRQGTTTYIDIDLHKGWPNNTGIINIGGMTLSFLDQPTIADIDKDGKKDLVTAYGQTINVLNHEGIPLSGWPLTITTPYSSLNNDLTVSTSTKYRDTNTGGTENWLVTSENITSSSQQAMIQMGPAVGDLDNDGYNEIVVGDNAGYIHVLNHDGTYVFQPEQIGGYITNPTLADIDKDGFLDIVAGDWWGYLRVLNKDGFQLWSKYLEPIEGYPAFNNASDSSAVADLDNDGYNEIVVGNSSCQYWSYCVNKVSRIWVLDKTGTTLNGWPKDFIQEGKISEIALADIDNDGQKEIISGFFNGYVKAWNVDGSIVPNWQIVLSNPGEYGAYLEGPSIGDIDNDGQVEMAFTANTNYDTAIFGNVNWGCLFVYDNGTIANGFPVCSDWTNIKTQFSGIPILADLDSDPQMEITARSDGGYFVNNLALFYIVNHDGSIVSGFPKYLDDSQFGSIAPADDIDNDGKNELIVGTWRGTTLVYDFPGNSINNQWPVYMHNPQHTGCYDCQQAAPTCALGHTNNGDGSCTATFEVGSGDGETSLNEIASWDSVHDRSIGQANGASTITSSITIDSARYSDGHTEMFRGFLPFDTTSIPDNAQILSAKLSVYAYGTIIKQDNDASAFIGIVQTTQASPTSLTASDYSKCGAYLTVPPTAGQKTLDSIVSSQYNEINLNSTGLAWISKTGWTKLGLREGHDISDHAIDSGKSNIVTILSRESTQNKPAKLTVVYTP